MVLRLWEMQFLERVTEELFKWLAPRAEFAT